VRRDVMDQSATPVAADPVADPVADTPPRDPRLITGEEVIFSTEKHWLAPVTDSLMAVLLIIGSLVLAWLQTPQTDGIMGFVNRVLNLVANALMLGGIGWIIYNIVAWRSAKYLLTTQRVMFQEGLLRKKSAETLLSTISDVKMSQGFLGKQLGFGSIQIMGASGEAGADNFTSIRGAEQLKRKLLEQKIAASSSPPPVMVAAPTASAPAQPTQADIMATVSSLATLRDSGATTPDEYESKKTDLLARI
jgi:uncharacterized membrane protein YdbT with pleckstrin-like domain